MKRYIRSMTEEELDYAIENNRPFDLATSKKYKIPMNPRALSPKDVRVGDIIRNTESSEEIDWGTVFQVIDIDTTDPDNYSQSNPSLRCNYTITAKLLDAPEVVRLHYYDDEDLVGEIAYDKSTPISSLPQDYQDEYRRSLETILVDPAWPYDDSTAHDDSILKDDPGYSEVERYMNSTIGEVDKLFDTLKDPWYGHELM